jgi:hypothetical protein
MRLQHMIGYCEGFGRLLSDQDAGAGGEALTASAALSGPIGR